MSLQPIKLSQFTTFDALDDVYLLGVVPGQDQVKFTVDTLWNHLPVASSTSKGIVSVGDFLNVSDDGVLSVSIGTDNVSEGSNLYFTEQRARSSINFSHSGNHGAASYNPVTGSLNVPVYLSLDEREALWVKAGGNIVRNSDAFVNGVFHTNEIKSFTDGIPLVRRDGSNVRFSTSILADTSNSRVGIFTDQPLDHLHLTGFARISTLAEAGNNSLVYANEHGRLVKIPFANDPLRFFRSDGTWGFQATEAIDVFDAVIGMQQDASLAPALTIGARYIILNPNSLHSSFGSITGLGNNDIVRYDGSNWVVAFDSSASLVSVKVLVTLDTGGQHNNFWLYSVVSGVWVNQGQAAEHDSLWGINASWKHLSSSEYNFFTSLVNGGTIYTTSNLGSGVAGRIPFWAGDRAMAHSDVLIWDNGNNRLSVGGNVTTSGRIVQSSNGMFYYRNLTSIFLGVGTVTGTIKINLPPSKRWSNTMMKCRISGFNYSGNLRGTSWELEVGGYNFSEGGWYNVYARIQGVAPFTSVRLGDDGTRNVILLGVTSTAWDFASICVTDFMATFMNSSGYEDGWSIDLITNETGISSIASPSIDLTIGTDGSYRFSQTPSVSGIAVSLSDHAHTFASLTSRPSTLAGYGITDAAPLSHNHSFASLTSIPTTLAGYGITDAAPLSHTHTFASLTSRPTTLAGYGITDATTSNIAEGTNLYFTNARARNAIFSPSSNLSSSVWDCNEGLNRTFSLISNFSISFANMSNGLNGSLILFSTGVFSLTINSIPNFSRFYLLSSLYHFNNNTVTIPSGFFLLTWVANNNWVFFNIGQYGV